MITHKKKFYLALGLLCLASIFITTFPHRDSLGVLLFKTLHIPKYFGGGFDTVGIVTLFLLIGGIYLLGTALEKFRMRIGILALILVFLLPSLIINSYQKTFAVGIYALDYEKDESFCQFDMSGPTTLHGECYLPLTNHTNKELTFSLLFFEELYFEDDFPVVSLMNENGPFTITLGPKESRRILLETDIDVSNMERYIEGGNANFIDINVSANGKKREL